MRFCKMICGILAAARGTGASAANPAKIGGRTSRTRRCNVQSPPRSTFDGIPGNGTIEPNFAPPPPTNRNDVT